jgi:hypothetical protein
MWIRISQGFEYSLMRDVTNYTQAISFMTFTVAWAAISYTKRIAYPSHPTRKCWLAGIYEHRDCFSSAPAVMQCVAIEQSIEELRSEHDWNVTR